MVIVRYYPMMILYFPIKSQSHYINPIQKSLQNNHWKHHSYPSNPIFIHFPIEIPSQIPYQIYQSPCLAPFLASTPGETSVTPWPTSEARGVHQGVAFQGHRARAAGEGVAARDLDVDWLENLNRKPWFLHSLPSMARGFRFQFSHHSVLWI